MSTLRAAALPSPGMPSADPVSGRGKWMALLAAFLGWMFDGVEIGLFPLVARPLLQDLLPGANEGEIGRWISVITAGFLVGAATGGVLFGWLGDRIGRVRAMTLSVLTYAIFTGLCAPATSAEQVAFLRFVAALGMGGEWSLGVALVMEIWPDRSRAVLAGLIGAAANVGFLLIAWIGTGVTSWRLLMLLGASPALLTFFIRLFVPESRRWAEERERGGATHWAARDLTGVLVGACGAGLIIYLWARDATPLFGWAIEHSPPLRLLGTLLGLAVAVVGYTFPVLRYVQREAAAAENEKPSNVWRPTLARMLLAACLSGVPLLGTWGSIQFVPSWADELTGGLDPSAKAFTQMYSGLGAVVGCMAGALLGDWIGRRPTYTLLCVAALASSLALFQLNDSYGPRFLLCSFVAGVFTASFYGWLPLYLPELFRTRVRATAQGFGYNFGRILAAIGVLQAGSLIGYFRRPEAQASWLGQAVEALHLPNQAGYPLACSLMSGVYLLGMVIIWLAPETRGRSLPE